MMSCNRFMTIRPRERAMNWFRPFIGTTAAVAALVSVQAVAQNERELLAPTGRLRVGVYLGSPLSMVHDRATVEAGARPIMPHGPVEDHITLFHGTLWSRQATFHRGP
jgi:hypothetical protein